MNRTAIVAVSCVAGILSAGCSTTMRSSRQSETDQLKNQVASLESQVGALNQKVAELSQNQGQGRQPAKSNIIPAARVTLSPKKIQVALKAAGYYAGPVDGKIGAQTRDAVKAFQKAKGLSPDGVVGSKTAAALARVLTSDADSADNSSAGGSSTRQADGGPS